MRTKTLLIAASALAAAVNYSSQAQSTVYSQNVVGYVNITVAAGKQVLAANQLDLSGGNFSNGSNSINNCFINGPVSGKTYAYIFTGAGFKTLTYDNSSAAPGSYGPGWYGDNGNAPSTDQLNPGNGCWLVNGAASSLTVTTVGNVLQGTNQLTVQTGQQIYSVPDPFQNLPLDNTNVNFPGVSGKSFIYAWTGSGFSTLTYDNSSAAPGSYGPGWYGPNGNVPADNYPTNWPSPGQSVWINNGAGHTLNWNQIFTVP